MARRKRASMREGPLADLFRSTAREDREQSKEQPTEQHEASGAPAEEATSELGASETSEPESSSREPAEEPEPTPPDPERVRAYRLEETSIPPPKERLSRIFADEAHDV